MSKAKVTVVSYDEFTDIDFKAPTAFYNKDAMGEFVFYHTRSREVAQEWCNDRYGAGRYKVNAAKISKSKGELSVTGTATRKK